ncbi:MAG TPA: response regulator [Bryobacteraceae bacterium]|nr:response regulator [Bryobacteraceae bacterium]
MVEDSSDDLVLMQKAFAKAGLTNPLQIVRNGEEAVAYLQGDEPYQNRHEHPRPDLIFLDLKMPKMDGFEFLKWLRAQEGIGKIPVVVLTSSHQMRDVNQAYALGANSFLVKPFDFDNFVETSKLLRTYWLHVNYRPESFRAGESKAKPRNPRKDE